MTLTVVLAGFALVGSVYGLLRGETPVVDHVYTLETAEPILDSHVATVPLFFVTDGSLLEALLEMFREDQEALEFPWIVGRHNVGDVVVAHGGIETTGGVYYPAGLREREWLTGR